MGQKLTKEVQQRKFQKVQEQSIFHNFDFVFYWDTTCNGNPSLEAAIAFFAEAEPTRFARLPFEILWKIFTMKQEAEMIYFVKNSNDNKIGRLEKQYGGRWRFRLTRQSYHPRERMLESRDPKGLKKLLMEFRDIMHLEKTNLL
jgi:hypothetical protein